MDFDRYQSLLRESGLFDPGWYGARNPDVARSGLDPETHFLRYGGALRRSPGPGFDARAYRAAYWDVEAAGVDPVLHYLLHGRAEGRATDPGDLAAVARAESLAAHLWGGLGEEMVPALEAVADDPAAPAQARFAALLHLAVWRDFHGGAAAALALLDRAAACSPGQAHLPALQLRRALLLGRARDMVATGAALDRLGPARQGAPDVILARAAADPDPGAPGAALNRVWRAAGLAALADGSPGFGGLRLPAPLPPAPGGAGLVSVIVPAFRAARTLGHALDSLRAQSYRDLEILVVDDRSPDDTAALAEALAARDPRIRLIRAARNGGAYAARNLGLAQARGDFITTHDADDWSHPEKIARQVAALAAAPGAMASVSDWLRVRPDLRATPGWRLNDHLVHYSHPSFLFRRALSDRLGGWDPVRVGGDTEFIWRCEARFGAGAVLRVLPGVPLALALDAEGSLTRVPATHARTIFHGLRHYYREISRHWHARPDADTPEGRAARAAMLPPAILDPDAPPPRVDLLATGDFRRPDHVARMARLRAGGGRLGIAHVPDPGLPASLATIGVRFCPALFDLLAQPGVRIVLPQELAALAARLGPAQVSAAS